MSGAVLREKCSLWILFVPFLNSEALVQTKAEQTHGVRCSSVLHNPHTMLCVIKRLL